MRKTSSRGKVRLRLSLRRVEISSQTDTITTNLERTLLGQSGPASAQVVSAVFREPVLQVLEKIKNEPFFKWPNKMTGNPLRCN